MGPIWSVAAPGGGACWTEGTDDGGGDGDDESHERSLSSGDEDRVQGRALMSIHMNVERHDSASCRDYRNR